MSTAAVAYYRMSHDRQDTSIEEQRREVEALAAKNGYRLVREYKDEGISGDATERRLEFQRMIRDSARRDFSVILCWDQDRFGRFRPLEAATEVKEPTTEPQGSEVDAVAVRTDGPLVRFCDLADGGFVAIELRHTYK